MDVGRRCTLGRFKPVLVLAFLAWSGTACRERLVPSAAPSSVIATPGNERVTVTWSPVAGARSYNLYWSTASGVTKATGNRIAGVTSPFVQTGLNSDMTYFYVVTAVNVAGESSESMQVSAKPSPPPPGPAGAAATPGNGQATVTWKSVTGASSYNLYWSTTFGVTRATGSEVAGVTSPFVQTGLMNGATYYYVVTWVSDDGESAESTEVSATPTTVPAAPAAVTATPGNGQATISWSAVRWATSYNLYCSTTSGVTKTNGTQIANATSSYVQSGLVNGTTYYLVVTAVNSVGESAESAQVSVAPTTAAPPAAPTGLTATPGDGQVTLAWSASTGATSYNLYWSTKYGPTKVGGTQIVGATRPYVQTGLTNGTTYYYVVTAVNANGESAESTHDAATPMTVSGRELCVANAGSDTIGTFDALQNGDGAPLRLFGSFTGLYVPHAVYVDSVNDEIGVANYSSVTVFSRTDNGNVAPVRTIWTKASDLYGIYVDTVNNEIGVLSFDSYGSITVYSRTATGNATPLRTISGIGTGLSYPQAICVDTVNDEILVAAPTYPSFGSPSITVYSRVASGDATPLRTISGPLTGLSWPQGVYVDTVDDEIGVADLNNAVMVYSRTANGNVAPLRTILGASTGLSDAYGIYVDTTDGEIAVTNLGVSSPSITVYDRTAAGDVAPLRTISGASTGLVSPFGVYVDAVNAEIGVADRNNAITVYSRTATGNAAPLRTISSGTASGLASPYGIYVDAVNDELGVVNYRGESFTVYSRTANGEATPLRTISGASTDLVAPTAVYVDAANNEVGVASPSRAITVFDRTANGNVMPLRLIQNFNWPTSGLDSPSGIYVDTTNNEIGVADAGRVAIMVFGRTASGDAAPIRTIAGASTGLVRPWGIYVDTNNDEVGVTDSESASIMVFSRTADGDVPPLRMISGVFTGLVQPSGIYVDTAVDEIGVTNADNSITVYDRNATGNVAPLRTISGPGTLLVGPVGIAVCR